MKRNHISYVLFSLVCICILLATFWYMQSHVKLVSKGERRAIVVSEVTTALERYYDEHGRYPVVYTNDDLMRELSAKRYFKNDVRLDVVTYVPLNSGQTFELR